MRSTQLRIIQSSPTIEQAFAKYLLEISSKKKSYKEEKSIIRAWAKTAIYTKPIASVKPSHLIKVKDEWLLSLKPATVNRRFAMLSNLYTVAIKDWLWSYLKDNPVRLIRKPSVKNDRNRRIYQNITIKNSNIIESPTNELDWILRETQAKQLPTIITLAVETAMRRSEIVNIKMEHIDFEQGTIYLPDTKNGEPRLVPLTPIAKFSLINYVALTNPKGRLFSITSSAVTGSFLRACAMARRKYESICKAHHQEPSEELFRDLCFHDLRHEATSRLAEVYEMHELAKITGHKDTRMLLRYYHPDISKLTNKFAQSKYGQEQFNLINKLLLRNV